MYAMFLSFVNIYKKCKIFFFNKIAQNTDFCHISHNGYKIFHSFDKYLKQTIKKNAKL